MSAWRSARRVLDRRLLGQRLGTWLLWTAAVAVLSACPVIIADPGMWPYLLDPELLALVVVVGLQYTRLELGVLRLQLRAWRCRRRPLRQRGGCACRHRRRARFRPSCARLAARA